MILSAVILTLSAGWLTLVSGLAIPFITGLVTKAGVASPGVKGVITLVLAAVAGVLSAVVNSNGVLESATLIDGLVTLGISVLWLYSIHLPFDLDNYLLKDKGFGTDPEQGGI